MAGIGNVATTSTTARSLIAVGASDLSTASTRVGKVFVYSITGARPSGTNVAVTSGGAGTTDGVVTSTDADSLGGTCIVVLGPGGHRHYYGHLERHGRLLTMKRRAPRDNSSPDRTEASRINCPLSRVP